MCQRAKEATAGLVIDHSLETMLLRSAPPHIQAKDIVALLKLVAKPASGAVAARKILDARNPTKPPTRQPWEAGYAAAIEFRGKMGWADDNAPPMRHWLSTEGGVETSATWLDQTIDGAIILTDSHVPLIHVNPLGQQKKWWSERMMWATGLGHLVMDPAIGANLAVVDSLWTHWPSAARARAFAAMLLMPEAGVRAVVRKKGGANLESVKELMREYETGPVSTTWHLKNLGVISEDERVRLVRGA
jgi:Zn-dependent peptidase ImmA (M78 family)